MGEKKIRIMYLCIHKRLLGMRDFAGIIKRKKFYETVCRLYHLPFRLRKIVLNEMIEMELVERIDKDSLKILDKQINLKNTSLVYQDF